MNILFRGRTALTQNDCGKWQRMFKNHNFSISFRQKADSSAENRDERLQWNEGLAFYNFFLEKDKTWDCLQVLQRVASDEETARHKSLMALELWEMSECHLSPNMFGLFMGTEYIFFLLQPTYLFERSQK